MEGYLQNPNATDVCAYCPYKDGREYMAYLNVQQDDQWRCLGIFVAFTFLNWLLIYVLTYGFRVGRWAFGIPTMVQKARTYINRPLRKCQTGDEKFV